MSLIRETASLTHSLGAFPSIKGFSKGARFNPSGIRKSLQFHYSTSDCLSNRQKKEKTNQVLNQKEFLKKKEIPNTQHNGINKNFISSKTMPNIILMRNCTSFEQIPTLGSQNTRIMNGRPVFENQRKNSYFKKASLNPKKKKWEQIFTDEFYERIENFLDKQGFSCINPLDEIQVRKKSIFKGPSGIASCQDDLKIDKIKQNLLGTKSLQNSPLTLSNSIKDSTLLNRRASRSQESLKFLHTILDVAPQNDEQAALKAGKKNSIQKIMKLCNERCQESCQPLSPIKIDKKPKTYPVLQSSLLLPLQKIKSNQFFQK